MQFVNKHRSAILFTLTITLFLVCNIPILAQTNNALQFNGTNQYVDCGNNATIQITGPAITLEAWIYAWAWGDSSYSGPIIAKTANERGYSLRCGAGGKLNFIVSSAGNVSRAITDIPVLILNTWHHVAGVYDGSNLIVYVDGREVKRITRAANIGGTSNPLWLASDGYAPTRHFNGKIDEVRIWNIARTQEEIQAYIDRPIDPLPSGLVAYYKFDSNSGTILTDEKGTNDGTLQGSPSWVESYAMVVPKTTGATEIDYYSFRANWTRPVTGTADKYFLDVATDQNFTLMLSRYNNFDVEDTTNKTVDSLQSGKTYYYRVRAYKSSVGSSTNSNITQVTTDSFMIEIPTPSIQGVTNSSVAWGDYDNDGDLDILLTGNDIASIYRNDGGGTFTYINAGLPGVNYSSVAWGDYDNDGDLDILLTGNGTASIYRNDGGGTFTDINAGLPGVDNGSVAWGDYNNDGDLDILLAGNGIASIYRNDGGGTFTDIKAGLPGIYNSSVAWGDYDNDGDLDILLTGNGTASIYRNDGGETFRDFNAGLLGIYNSSVAWGDYDNDGDLDILLTGDSDEGLISKIYRNDGGETFRDFNAGLLGVGGSSVSWGDYDNDGDLDILLTGYFIEEYDEICVTKIYRNDGNGIFKDICFGLPQVAMGSTAWGDYDNDGDLDVILTGDYEWSQIITKIYRNDFGITNTAPSQPNGPTALIDTSSVILSWNKSNDHTTPQSGLTYNIRIDTISNGIRVVSPMANLTDGYRRIPHLGNSGYNTSRKIDSLRDGKYYWSVQAIDNAFAGSAFSKETTFYAFMPGPVSASDDEPEPKEITINWGDNSRNETDFLVYRDDINPTILSYDMTSYIDATAKPGIIYKYSVAARFAGGRVSRRVSDYGRIPDDGMISGIVKTLSGGAVPDVEVFIERSDPNRYKAISFDGIGAFVQIPHDNSLNIVNNYTIEAWIYPRSLNDSAVILSKNFRLGLRNDQPAGIIFDDAFTDSILSEDQWYHIAAVNNNGVRKLYCNGVEQILHDTSTSLVANELPLTIGKGFDGVIDEVRVWNIARSEGDIKKTMPKYLQGDEDGIIGYWRFDEDTSTTFNKNKTVANDFSSNANYGILKNGAVFTDFASPAKITVTTISNVSPDQDNYVFKNLNYGNQNTYFTLKARKTDRTIKPDSLIKMLTTTNNPLINITFTDESAITMSGSVQFANTSPACPIDSVEFLIDNMPAGRSGNGGAFSIPMSSGIHTIKPRFKGHTFSPDSIRKNFFADTSGVIFLDTQTHTVHGVVAAGACKYTLGSATIQIMDTTGCITKTQATNSMGAYTITLPATKYSMRVIYLNPNNLDAIEYFAPRPQYVSLIQSDQQLDFIYRTPPDLNISGIPAQGNCPIPVVQQGRVYPLKLRVLERYGDRSCYVDSGQVEISDDVGDIDTATIVQIRNGFGFYPLRPGFPNILSGGIKPYQKRLEVTVSTPGGAQVVSNWMMVTGAKPREKTFTTVSPEIPVLILRDPPGDGSYSFISKTTTICQTVSFSVQTDASINRWQNVRLGFGAEKPFFGMTGAYVEVGGSLELGAKWVNTDEQEFCFTTKSKYSTSSEEQYVGSDADVYNGGAINLLYAICDILEYDVATCQPKLSKSLALGGTGFKTTFSYTEHHIKNVLIRDLRNLANIYISRNNLDSARIYLDQLEVWEQVVDRNTRLKKDAIFSLNRTFSAGANDEYSEETKRRHATNFEFNAYLTPEVTIELGADIVKDYSSTKGGQKLRFSYNTGNSTKNETTTMNEVGYGLKDNDIGDAFSVDIKKDMVYGTPVFDLVGGSSSCPWEQKTFAREGVSLSIDPTVQYSVPSDSLATFTITLGNLSNETNTYRLEIDEASAQGATIKINDKDFIEPEIDSMSNIIAEVTVKKGQNNYNYEDLQLIFKSRCDGQIVDKKKFSVFFDDGINDPPIAYGRTIVTKKNVQVECTLQAFDPEGSGILYTVVAPPNYGSLRGAPPNLIYTPNTNYSGIDNFYFAATDDNSTARGTMKINVQNAPPTISPSYSSMTTEDSLLTIVVTATDSDGDSLSYSITQNPTNGAISGTPPNYVYTPSVNFYGNDMFRVGVSDGSITSQASVIVTVNPVSDPPDIADDYGSLNIGESNVIIPILQNDTDPDNDSLWIIDSILVGSSGQAVVNLDGTITYTPSITLNKIQENSYDRGTDTLRYSVTDGIFTREGKVFINLDPTNNRPIAGFGSSLSFDGKNDYVRTGFNSQLNTWTIELWVKSPDGPVNNDTSVLISRGKNFQIYWDNPDANRRGSVVADVGGTEYYASYGTILPDQWYYIAATYDGDTLKSYINGALITTNSSPSGNPSNEDSTLKIGSNIIGTENFDGIIDEVRVWNTERSSSQIAADMQIIIDEGDPSLIGYWRFDERNGTITYDATGNSSHGILQNMTNPWIDVDNVFQFTTDEEVSVPVSLSAYDKDDDTLTYVFVSQAVNGTLSGTPPNITYIPNHNFNGYEYITYEVNDGSATSNTPATIAIRVNPVNDPPIANIVSTKIQKNRSSIVLLDTSDPDNDSLVYKITLPTYGSIITNDTLPWVVKYTPNTNFIGVDSLVYKVYDRIDSASAKVYITVTNTAPVGENQIFSSTKNNELIIKLIGSDSDGDPVSFAILQGPIFGTAVLKVDTIVYQPNTDFIGTDSLLFTVNDGLGLDTASIKIVILSPLDVKEEKGLPDQFKLESNYPNPFNPITIIEYSLPVMSNVKLTIYNILGQEVKILVDDIQAPGFKSMKWNSISDWGTPIASGVYFYRIHAVSVSDPNRTFTQVKKMLLLK